MHKPQPYLKRLHRREPTPTIPSSSSPSSVSPIPAVTSSVALLIVASSSATGRTPRQSRVPTNSQSGSQILIRSTSSPIYDISPTSATSDDSTTTTAEQEELTNEDSDTGSEETAEYGTSTLDGITSDEESMTLSEEETLSGGGGNTVTVIVAGSTTVLLTPTSTIISYLTATTSTPTPLPQTAPVSITNSKNSNPHLSHSAQAGIIVGTILSTLLATFLLYLLFKKCQRKKASPIRWPSGHLPSSHFLQDPSLRQSHSPITYPRPGIDEVEVLGEKDSVDLITMMVVTTPPLVYNLSLSRPKFTATPSYDTKSLYPGGTASPSSYETKSFYLGGPATSSSEDAPSSTWDHSYYSPPRPSSNENTFPTEASSSNDHYFSSKGHGHGRQVSDRSCSPVSMQLGDVLDE